jgi:hypothetical protein
MMRPGAYEIAASVRERYVPAREEFSVLRQLTVQQGQVIEPESDLEREIATMQARIEELDAKLDQTKNRTAPRSPTWRPGDEQDDRCRAGRPIMG